MLWIFLQSTAAGLGTLFLNQLILLVPDPRVNVGQCMQELSLRQGFTWTCAQSSLSPSFISMKMLSSRWSGKLLHCECRSSLCRASTRPTSSLITEVITGETFNFFQLKIAAKERRRCFVAGVSLLPCVSPCLPGKDEDEVWGTASGSQNE